MRSTRSTCVALLALLLAGVLATGGVAQQARAAQPEITVHPHWRRLAGHVGNVVAGGSDMAFTHYPGTGPIRLLNKRTHETQAIYPPTCTDPNTSTLMGFAGGRLAIGCGSANYSIDVDLLDLAAGTWTTQAIDPSLCVDGQACDLDGFGTTWIRFEGIFPGGCESHCTDHGYLQNIATGAVITDPADNRYQQDSLNTPSGLGHACGISSRAYQIVSGPAGVNAGRGGAFYYQLGSFVLQQGTTNKLYRCGTDLARRLPDGVFGSPKAVLYQHRMGTEFGDPIEGLILPTLRPFDIPHPIGIPVALSKTTLYTTNDQDDLWAGTLRFS